MPAMVLSLCMEDTERTRNSFLFLPFFFSSLECLCTTNQLRIWVAFNLVFCNLCCPRACEGCCVDPNARY